MNQNSPILREPQISGEHFKLAIPHREEKLGGVATSARTSASGTHEVEHTSPENHTVDADHSRHEHLGHEAGYEAGYEEGYEKGHGAGMSSGEEAGRERGEAEGRAAYTAGLLQLEQLAKNLNKTVERSLTEAEEMMVSIVFESVCKIVGHALATKDGVVAVVREALARTRDKSALIIRVNPLDLDLIEESAAFGIASEADWRADEAVPMGGCMIESEYGTLDARIDTQLNQLKRTLLATHHKRDEEAGGD